MIVFKNYLKVAKSYSKMIISYTVIFLVMAVFMMSSGTSTNTFESVDARIAIVNHDTDSKFITGFEDYVKEEAELVSIDSDEDSLKDALFFRKVDYIIIVPKGYTESFMKGDTIQMEVLSVPDSTSAIYSKQLMNKYLNISSLYLKAGISEEVLAEKVKEDLSQQATVTITNSTGSTDLSNARTFYNFANYTLLAVCVACIAMIMLSFTEEKIRRRNLVSPLSYKAINRQLLLGSIVVILGIWLLYVVISFTLYPEVMMSGHGLLFIANSATLLLCILAISFLITNLTNERAVISGVSNVISLGSSFIAGAFVPQALLGSFVLTIAKATPSYWYIKNNNDIVKISEFSWETLQPIFMNMAIIVGFALLFYILIQMTGKLKLKK